jgi:heat shock protein HslJ
MKILFAAGLCFLMACQDRGDSNEKKADTTATTALTTHVAPDTTTLGGTWYLQPVLASDTAAGKVPILQLDLKKSKFTGNTGCNNMRGSFWYSKTDSSLSFSDKITMTRMACPGYNEPAFVKSLQHTNHYRLRNGMLTLLAEDNSELSHWTRQRAIAAKVNKA